ncbi:uncharacterized protein PAC_11344 [Phialocephala subalpina]|uniref:Uncharacterized protein n=1 Tax=Phialocephala subalpina TaxID=576137 RepID=A0A1L7X8T2_9HELO|nr:uncharacterized protein PAC_11344 [Phialocephala subalpina]
MAVVAQLHVLTLNLIQSFVTLLLKIRQLVLPATPIGNPPLEYVNLSLLELKPKPNFAVHRHFCLDPACSPLNEAHVHSPARNNLSFISEDDPISLDIQSSPDTSLATSTSPSSAQSSTQTPESSAADNAPGVQYPALSSDINNDPGLVPLPIAGDEASTPSTTLNTESGTSDLTSASSPTANIIPKVSHSEKTSIAIGSPATMPTSRHQREDSSVQITAAATPSRGFSEKTTSIGTFAMHIPNSLSSRQGERNMR